MIWINHLFKQSIKVVYCIKFVRINYITTYSTLNRISHTVAFKKTIYFVFSNWFEYVSIIAQCGNPMARRTIVLNLYTYRFNSRRFIKVVQRPSLLIIQCCKWYSRVVYIIRQVALLIHRILHIIRSVMLV